MHEIVGDIKQEFGNPQWDAFCCTINTVVGRDGLVMGAGVARVFRDYFPGLAKRWGERVAAWGSRPSTYVLIEDAHDLNNHQKWLVGFPTKHDWKLPSPIALVERSAKQLRIIIEAMDLKNVLLPRPGCSNGGLCWAQVKPILEPIFDDRVTIISQ